MNKEKQLTQLPEEVLSHPDAIFMDGDDRLLRAAFDGTRLFWAVYRIERGRLTQYGEVGSMRSVVPHMDAAKVARINGFSEPIMSGVYNGRKHSVSS